MNIIYPKQMETEMEESLQKDARLWLDNNPAVRLKKGKDGSWILYDNKEEIARIFISEQHIRDFECKQLHCKDNQWCVHLSACSLLFEKKHHHPSPKKKQIRPKQIISKIPEVQLKDFVYKHLRTNKWLAAEFSFVFADILYDGDDIYEELCKKYFPINQEIELKRTLVQSFVRVNNALQDRVEWLLLNEDYNCVLNIICTMLHHSLTMRHHGIPNSLKENLDRLILEWHQSILSYLEQIQSPELIERSFERFSQTAKHEAYAIQDTNTNLFTILCNRPIFNLFDGARKLLIDWLISTKLEDKNAQIVIIDNLIENKKSNRLIDFVLSAPLDTRVLNHLYEGLRQSSWKLQEKIHCFDALAKKIEAIPLKLFVLAKLIPWHVAHGDTSLALKRSIQHYMLHGDKHIFRLILPGDYDMEQLEKKLLKNAVKDPVLLTILACWSRDKDYLIKRFNRDGTIDLLCASLHYLPKDLNLKLDKYLVGVVDKYLNKHFGEKACQKIEELIRALDESAHNELVQKLLSHIKSHYGNRKSLRKLWLGRW